MLVSGERVALAMRCGPEDLIRTSILLTRKEAFDTATRQLHGPGLSDRLRAEVLSVHHCPVHRCPATQTAELAVQIRIPAFSPVSQRGNRAGFEVRLQRRQGFRLDLAFRATPKVRQM